MIRKVNKMKESWILVVVVGLVFAGFFVGCGGEKSEGEAQTQPKAVLPAGIVADSCPVGAKPIAELKKTAKKGDPVVIHGMIGGSKKPFVSQWATVTIVDLELKNSCLNSTCGCSTPWDYCCGGNDKMPHMATVQITDSDGKPYKGTLRGVAGMDRLGILTVEGTVQQVEGNTLVVNAVKLYCEPYNPNKKVQSSCGDGCTDH